MDSKIQILENICHSSTFSFDEDLRVVTIPTKCYSGQIISSRQAEGCKREVWEGAQQLDTNILLGRHRISSIYCIRKKAKQTKGNC